MFSQHLDLQNRYNLLDIIKLKNFSFYNKILKNNWKNRIPIAELKKEIIKIRNNNNNLYIIVPQYQSSICVDDCKYCGFRKSNKLIIRKNLTDEEFENEFNLLLNWGYRIIELVYSTDPDATALNIGKRINLAKKLASNRNINVSIGLNANVFSVNGYKILKESGLDFLILWMETYDKDNYKKWHKKNTPKYNYEYRLDAYERAINAGIHKIGMGVLFGLSNWEKDIVKLFNHALYLEQNYKISPFIFGIPRLKNSFKLKIEKANNTVDDNTFEYIINIYRLCFPKTKIFINTREDYNMNIDKLLYVGGDLFTIDCATFPGAYLNNEYIIQGNQQFNTFIYKKDSVIEMIKKLHLEIKNSF